MRMISTGKIKKYFATFLAAVMLCLVLGGCQEIRIDTSMDKDLLLQVGSTTCSMQEAIFRLLEERIQYEAIDSDLLWKRDIGGETMGDYIKESVKNEMIRNTTCLLMSDSMALYLTEEQEAQAAIDAQNAYEKLQGIYDLGKYGITLETVQSLYYKRAVYEMLYETLSEDVPIEISEADTKVIQVSYVFIPADDGYDKAEDLRSVINGGEGFEYACEHAGYEPVLSRVLMHGDMPESFERVAYALLDGEMSEVVEDGKNGYYLIYCMEDYMVAESIANKNKILSETKKANFDEQYTSYTAKKKLQFNTAEWDNIDIEGL